VDNKEMRAFVNSVLSCFSEEELEAAMKETDDEKRLDFFVKGVNAWVTKRLQALFPWVERVEVDKVSGAITVEHSYPEGVNISSYVREILGEKLPQGIPVDIRDVRVASSHLSEKVEEVP